MFSEGQIPIDVLGQLRQPWNGYCVQNNSDFGPDSKSRQLMEPHDGLVEGSLRLHQLMGYDSFLGEFVGDGVRLRFDYGRYSNGYLKNAKKPAHILSKTIYRQAFCKSRQPHQLRGRSRDNYIPGVTVCARS